MTRGLVHERRAVVTDNAADFFRCHQRRVADGSAITSGVLRMSQRWLDVSPPEKPALGQGATPGSSSELKNVITTSTSSAGTPSQLWTSSR